MNIEQFRTELICYFKNNHNSICVEECDVIKNNGVKLYGIVLKNANTRVLPTIYLEPYLNEYNFGKTIPEIAERILEINEKSQFKGEFKEEFFLDFDNIRPLLRVKIINTKQNEELLKSIPSRAFLDLSIVAYCDVSELCKVDATILVRTEHIKQWNVSEEELLNIAYANTRKQGTNVKDLRGLVEKCKDVDIESDHEIKDMLDTVDNRMYVCTSNQCIYGAICITFDDMLDEMVNNHKFESIEGINEKRGVYIIPSSIHEIILIYPESVQNEKYLNNMIESVNSESLSREEVLASHAYYYSPEEGYIIV